MSLECIFGSRPTPVQGPLQDYFKNRGKVGINHISIESKLYKFMKRIPMLLLYFLHSAAASLQASFVKEDAGCQGGISPPVNKPIPTADALITPIPLDSKNSIYSSKSNGIKNSMTICY